MKRLKSSYVSEIKKIIYNLIQKNYADPSIVFRGYKPEEIQEVIEDYGSVIKKISLHHLKVISMGIYIR